MAESWVPFERVEQLVGEAPPRGGAYITVSAFGAAGEKKVGRLELDGITEPVSQVRGLLDTHGREPGIEKCRVRLWRKGGVPGPSVTCRWDAAGSSAPAVESAPPTPGTARPKSSRTKASTHGTRIHEDPPPPAHLRRSRWLEPGGPRRVAGQPGAHLQRR